MKKILDDLAEKEKQKLKKKKQPQHIRPMLAKLTHKRFYEKGWLYERKLDGERCIALKEGKSVTLESRNRKKLNESYPEIEHAIQAIGLTRGILDGEIVAFEGNITSFARLQQRMHVKSRKEIEESNVAVYYYLFDIPYLEGYDLSSLSLITRKHILRKALRFTDPLRFVSHRVSGTKKYYREACRKGWEGLIVKKQDSTYIHARSSKWLKFKCVKDQEFVIGGYTKPQGSRIRFGALLLGYYKNKTLHYAGKVGTGFTDETLEELGDTLKGIEVSKNPFSEEVHEKNTHWVDPRLVCQIGFTEWTDENKLRHPRFLGIRRDKKPQAVRKES